MARPIKKGLDYFTHDVACSNERAIRYIESKYGLIGYAIYFKILEKIYGEEGYFIHWKPVDECIYSAEWGVEAEFLRNLLNDFFEIGLFTKWIYEANQVLTSSGIQARYHEAAKKRPKYDGIASFCVINAAPSGIDSAETPQDEEKDGIDSAESAQRKEEERKEKNKKNCTSKDARRKGFEDFWGAFALKEGKKKAEESWNKIAGYNDDLLAKILDGAKREAQRRPELIKLGRTPKWAQGWLTERRWEDEVATLADQVKKVDPMTTFRPSYMADLEKAQREAANGNNTR